MEKALERAISAASMDIADVMSDGRPGARRTIIGGFMVAALWAAVSAAKSMSSNSWVDSGIEDGWTKNAAEKKKYELPKLTDSQFREVMSLLGMDDDALRSMIPPRITLEPELESKIMAIIGGSPSNAIEDSGFKPVDKPESMESILGDAIKGSGNVDMPKPLDIDKPEPKIPSSVPVKNTTPAKRDTGVNSGAVMPQKPDEFDSRIEDNFGIPGDPRVKNAR